MAGKDWRGKLRRAAGSRTRMRNTHSRVPSKSFSSLVNGHFHGAVSRDESSSCWPSLEVPFSSEDRPAFLLFTFERGCDSNNNPSGRATNHCGMFRADLSAPRTGISLEECPPDSDRKFARGVSNVDEPKVKEGGKNPIRRKVQSRYHSIKILIVKSFRRY